MSDEDFGRLRMVLAASVRRAWRGAWSDRAAPAPMRRRAAVRAGR